MTPHRAMSLAAVLLGICGMGAAFAGDNALSHTLLIAVPLWFIAAGVWRKEGGK